MLQCVVVCCSVLQCALYTVVDGKCSTVVDGYCSTVQGLLDWFEVDLGFTELLFIQINLCVAAGAQRHCGQGSRETSGSLCPQ